MLSSLLFALYTPALAAQGGQPLQFEEVSLAVGIDATLENTPDHPAGPMNGGGSVADLNGDGYVDIFLPSGGVYPDRIYYGKADDTFRLSNPTVTGATALYRGVASTIGDYDKDGDLDIFITSYGDMPAAPAAGGHRLYSNNGDETFTDMAATAGVDFVSPTIADGWGACFGDYDLDGDLDLFVCGWQSNSEGNRLFRNEGDGTFVDQTVFAGFNHPFLRGFAPCFADLDGDRYPEILIAADFSSTTIMHNQRNGTFLDITDALRPDKVVYGMGSAVGDYNGDGLLDWYATSAYFDNDPGFANGNRLHLSEGLGGILRSAPFSAGVDDGGWGWGTVSGDFDLDGDLDIAEVNGWTSPEFLGESSYLFLNDGTANFTEESVSTGFRDIDQGRGLVCFDYQNDGDLDLLVCNNNGPVHLYRNDLSGLHRWLRVDVDTSANQALAPGGFATMIRADYGGSQKTKYLDGGTSHLGCSQMTAHFGLDDADQVDRLTVEWADGFRTVLEDVSRDQIVGIAAIEPLTQDAVLQRGSPFTSTLTGIVPDEMALFLGSFTGTTPFGTHIPALGGVILDLKQPIFLIGAAQADADGVATLVKDLPFWFPPVQVTTQAIVVRVDLTRNTIKSNPVARQILP
ncbi:MAG: CRTAC1 family protein [Planctomycetota bacterium]